MRLECVFHMHQHQTMTPSVLISTWQMRRKPDSKSASTTNETRFMKIRFKPRNMIELCGGENVSDTCKLEKEIKKPEKYHPM